jgi:anti-sigma B factor antagonist
LCFQGGAGCDQWPIAQPPDDSHTIIVAILHLESPLLAPVSADLRQGIQALLARGERRIVLDLSGVSNLDAAGLGELVRAYQMTAAADGVLRITHPSGRAREILARVGLFDLLSADSELFRTKSPGGPMAAGCAGRQG